MSQKAARPFSKKSDFFESATNLNLASGQWMLSWHRPNQTRNRSKKKVAKIVCWLLTECRNRVPMGPMIATGATKSARKRRERIAGIGRSAAALQVTRQHLRLVIRGDRVSKSLVARYRALQSGRPKITKFSRP
jgi:hypothetical protein